MSANRAPLRIVVPPELAGLGLETLPDGAHFEFLCPFCQASGVFSRCVTSDADTLVWSLVEGEPPAALLRAAFHAVPCSACGRRIRMHAERDLRQGAAKQ